MARIYSNEEKEEYLAQYHASGKRKTEFARENNIPEATFRAWIDNENNSMYGRIDFERINNQESKVTNIVRPIIFMSDKIRIELQEGYSKELLKNVIEVLLNDTKVIE